MPQFSVLMANYNNGLFIDQAIASVLHQTFSDWELVIVDDASTDDSLERIKRYVADPRIRLFAKANNEGYTKALIDGLARVSSDIVGILDSDDALAPHAIEKVHAVYAARPEVGVVLSQMVVCDSELRPLLTTTNTPKHAREPVLWMRGCTHFRTFRLAAYAKTAGLDPNLKVEDWDLLFKLEEVSSAYRVDEPLYVYRQRPSSRSNASQTSHREARALALYKAYLRRRGSGIPNIPRPALMAWIAAAVEFSLDRGELMEAARFSARALRTAPKQAASWRALARCVKSAIALLAAHGVASHRLDATRDGHVRRYPICTLQTNTGNNETDHILCIPLVHKPGHCLFGGNHFVLQDGWYKATFEIAIEVFSPTENQLAVLDIYENLKKKAVLSERSITLADVTTKTRPFSLSFFAEAGQRVEFRIFWGGRCLLRAGSVILEMNSVDGVISS